MAGPLVAEVVIPRLFPVPSVCRMCLSKRVSRDRALRTDYFEPRDFRRAHVVMHPYSADDSASYPHCRKSCSTRGRVSFPFNQWFVSRANWISFSRKNPWLAESISISDPSISTFANAGIPYFAHASARLIVLTISIEPSVARDECRRNVDPMVPSEENSAAVVWPAIAKGRVITFFN